MARVLALSVLIATISWTPVVAGNIDPAVVTCKDYNSGSHQDMVDINAALHRSLVGDAKLGALSENELGDLMDKVCAANPRAKVIDALHSGS